MKITKCFPTPLQVKIFAQKLTKEQWDKLCKCPRFIEILMIDLEEAEKIARQILSTK